MSAYSNDRRLRIRRDDRREASSSRPVIERRVAGDRRARVTVETGGHDYAYGYSPVEQTFRIQPRADLRSSRPSSRYPSRPSTRRQDTSDWEWSEVDVDVDSRRRHSAQTPFDSSTAVPISGGESITYDIKEDVSVIGSEDSDDVEFRLPKVNKRVQFSEEDTFVISEPGKAESLIALEKSHGSAKTKFNGPLTELLISQSRWCGNTVDRGDVTGEVVLASISPNVAEKQPPPMMKWCHLERASMSFEEFMAASVASVDVSEKEQRDISLLLRDVQKKFEKQRHHGREMEPDCVSDVFYNGTSNSARPTASVLFLSFPFFCLEPYSYAPIRALSPGSPMHPTRPMLQSHFFSSSQARELAQAVAVTPGTPSGHCLHISQIWCLVVDGNTMITCSAVPIDKLCADAVKHTTDIRPDKRAHVKVSVGSDRSWLIPVSESTSWPAFLAMFGEKVAGMESQGASATFEHEGEIADGNSWPDIVAGATDSPPELLMRDVKFHVRDAEDEVVQDDAAGSELDLQHIHDQSRGAVRGPIPDIAIDEPMRSIPTPSRSMPIHSGPNLQLFKQAGSSADMRQLADSLQQVLVSNPRRYERDLYLQTPGAKSSDIDTWLKQDEDSSNVTESKEIRTQRKVKRRVVGIAKYLYCLFWPLEFEHAMSEKFWGALHSVSVAEDGTRGQSNDVPKGGRLAPTAVYRILRDDMLPIASLITAEFLTYEQDLKPLPEAFSKAWLHLITAMLYFAQPASPTKKVSFGEPPANKHLQAVTKELENAKLEIASRLHSIELEDFEICTESSILALLLNKLAGDVMHGRPDVPTSYSDYFQSLEFDITQNPSLRSFQQKLRDFLQEVQAILATLESQLSVLDVFERSLEQQSVDNDAILIYSLGTSRQSIVIQNCKGRISGRIDKSKGLQLRAEELGEWHQTMVESNKDRQENAIMVFTIVTIIFLPLSFVASVFGMNTRDVRDMPYSQWAYWAAGLPLTVFVIVGSLWWAGELEGVGSWFARTTSRSKKSAHGKKHDQERPAQQETTMRYQAPTARRDDAGLEEQLARPKRRMTYPHLH